MFPLRQATLVALLALGACNSAKEPAKAGIEVTNAWVRLPAVADRAGAAYFTLRNNGPDTMLAGMQSPAVQRIELHDSAMSGAAMGGMMHMTPIADVPLPHGGTVEFQPGGKHAMLFGIDPQLKAGGTIPLTFSFRDGHKFEAQAPLVDMGASPPQSP
jgi:copper(I)-binding protein